jgi:hypothetical protein
MNVGHMQHFKDGRPTDLHPDPVVADYNDFQRVPKIPKAPAKRRTRRKPANPRQEQQMELTAVEALVTMLHRRSETVQPPAVPGYCRRYTYIVKVSLIVISISMVVARF